MCREAVIVHTMEAHNMAVRSEQSRIDRELRILFDRFEDEGSDLNPNHCMRILDTVGANR